MTVKAKVMICFWRIRWNWRFWVQFRREFLIDLGSAAEDSDYYFSQSSEEYDWDEYFRGEYNDSEDERIAKYYYSKFGRAPMKKI